MNRQQKEIAIADIRRMMSEAQGTFLINYKGMTVSSLQGLRKKVRVDGGKVKVTKASLMRIAAQDIQGAEAFASSFRDQVGLVFAGKDISSLAKELANFAKEHEAMKIVAGFYESKVLTQQDIKMLASLPSRDVLIAQLLGTMQAPMTSFVRILNLLIARLAFVLKRIEEQQQEKQQSA